MQQIDPWQALANHPAIPFENEHVSPSRLKTYENCAKRFRYQYVEQAPKGASDMSAAELGIMVHSAFEIIFDWIRDEEFSGIIPEEVVVASYREAFDEASLTGVGPYREGFDLVRGYFNRFPDVDHWSVLEVEREFETVIDGIPFLGYMDRVDRISDDEIEIVDYKTNRMLFDRHELGTDIQASIYLMVAPLLWPWAKKFSFRFEMLRFDRSQIVTRTADDLDVARMYAVDLVRRIEVEGADWGAKIGPLCGWCPFSDLCFEYRDALTRHDEIVAATPEDLLALSAERQRIDQRLKPLDSRKKAIDKILKKRLEEEERLDLGEYVYDLTPISKTSYPIVEVIDVLARHSTTLDEKAIRDRLCGTTVGKAEVEAVAGEIRKQWEGKGSRSKKAQLSLELAGLSDLEFVFARLNSRLSSKALPKSKAGSNALPSGEDKHDDTPPPKCAFCQSTPAKLVERGGERFAVCQVHSRKRKLPKVTGDK